MATLTIVERVFIRRAAKQIANANDVPITWGKAAINAAAQAVDDALDGDENITRAECNPTTGTGFPAIVSARIDTATAPFNITFTTQQKKWISAFVMWQKYVRDNI